MQETKETQVWALGWEDPLENAMDRGAWQATVHGVAKSWTWQKQSSFCQKPFEAYLQVDPVRVRTALGLGRILHCYWGGVWLLELDHKAGWVPKNWCFQTVVLEKTLQIPLDCKEIKPVSPKGDQPWILTGRTDAEAEVPTLRPSDVKSWLTGKTLCWERLRAGEAGGRGWDGWMASLTQWTWDWANSRKMVQDKEAWPAVVHGLTKSWTWLSNQTSEGMFFWAVYPTPHGLPGFSTPEGGDTNASWLSLLQRLFHLFIPVGPSPEFTRTHTDTHKSRLRWELEGRLPFVSAPHAALSHPRLYSASFSPLGVLKLCAPSPIQGRPTLSVWLSPCAASSRLFPGSELGNDKVPILCCLSLRDHSSVGFCIQCLNTVLCLFLKSFKEGGCEG